MDRHTFKYLNFLDREIEFRFESFSCVWLKYLHSNLSAKSSIELNVLHKFCHYQITEASYNAEPDDKIRFAIFPFTWSLPNIHEDSTFSSVSKKNSSD